VRLLLATLKLLLLLLLYPSQTKILEGRTNISERIFEALFKVVSTGFGRQR